MTHIYITDQIYMSEQMEAMALEIEELKTKLTFATTFHAEQIELFSSETLDGVALAQGGIDAILEYASELDSFSDYVKESDTYTDLQEELEEAKEELAEAKEEAKEELDELKEELAEAKLAPSSEGIEFSKDVLEQFDDGDILECASECYGFQDIVEQSEFYIELKEELALVHTSTSRLLDEMKTELDEMKGANEDLVEQIGGVENDCEDRIEELKHEHRISNHTGNQMTVLLLKAIEELKTELRESQVDNVVNELVSQVCEGV